MIAPDCGPAQPDKPQPRPLDRTGASIRRHHPSTPLPSRPRALGPRPTHRLRVSGALRGREITRSTQEHRPTPCRLAPIARHPAGRRAALGTPSPAERREVAIGWGPPGPRVLYSARFRLAATGRPRAGCRAGDAESLPASLARVPGRVPCALRVRSRRPGSWSPSPARGGWLPRWPVERRHEAEGPSCPTSDASASSPAAATRPA